MNATSGERLDPAVEATAALVSLERMGPARIRRLLATHGDPESAWEAVEAGRVSLDDVGGAVSARPSLAAQWRAQARRRTPAELVDATHAAGYSIVHSGHPEWPECFSSDPEPPLVVFVHGDMAALWPVLVAIVGTRRCTAAGASIARELGRDLAAAGVGVVSGLALGIDGAAHRGALQADGAPVGVVATGLDVVYPRQHSGLWNEVGERGVLLSEASPGTPGERWRFPARNRLMASLAEIVVVVESNTRGGSMLTVDSAIERGTEVMAVPGSPRVSVSSGPNQLLADGCGIVRDATDVLVALGSRAPGTSATRPSSGGDQMSLDIEEDEVDPIADAISFPPIGLDRLVAVTGLSFGAVAARLTELEVDGVVERVGQGYQRRAD